MARHKTAELTGALLDAAVALALSDADGTPGPLAEYSQAWEDGGPIIERDGIHLFSYMHEGVRYWAAGEEGKAPSGTHGATTPLIAAMRAFVASKLGEEVELP